MTFNEDDDRTPSGASGYLTRVFERAVERDVPHPGGQPAFPDRPWAADDWRWADDEPRLQPKPGETFSEALTRMSPAAREMIRQYQGAEMTAAEIRESLGCSFDAVRREVGPARPGDNGATGLWPAIRDFHPFAEAQEAARQRTREQYEALLRYTLRGPHPLSWEPDGEPGDDAMTRSGEDTGTVW
jgi:hypothetical protein